MLFNNIAFALAVDALTNDGPGQPDSLDMGSICPTYSPPGSGVADILATETVIVVAVCNVAEHEPKVLDVPGIKDYAR